MSEAVLDDPGGLEQADPGDMLRAVASSGAQVRIGALAAREAGLDRLRIDERPRAIMVAGMGGSGIAGDVLAAVAGPQCSTPITTHREYTLPGWVGALDVVVAVSCSGTTEETLVVAEQAVRRGCHLVTVGAASSPLAELSEQARGLHIPVDAAGRLPRANIWALSVPLLVLADAMGITPVPPSAIDAAADLLDQISERCRPASESFVNPAKGLAIEMLDSLPMVWGSSEVAGVAAYRFACQLNENSKLPAVFGALPEVNHNQVVAFDGPYASGRRTDTDDFFRDRAEEPSDGTRLRLVLLRDTEEHPQVARRREITRWLAEQRGVAVSEVLAEGNHRLERLASLVGLTDYASVYLALALGIDPTPIAPIAELKERIAR